MYRYRCPRCDRQGLVRVETIIKASTSVMECYCGACDHTWTQRQPVAGVTEPALRKRPAE